MSFKVASLDTYPTCVLKLKLIRKETCMKKKSYLLATTLALGMLLSKNAYSVYLVAIDTTQEKDDEKGRSSISIKRDVDIYFGKKKPTVNTEITDDERDEGSQKRESHIERFNIKELPEQLDFSVSTSRTGETINSISFFRVKGNIDSCYIKMSYDKIRTHLGGNMIFTAYYHNDVPKNIRDDMDKAIIDFNKNIEVAYKFDDVNDHESNDEEDE